MTIPEMSEIINKIDIAYPNCWGHRDRAEVTMLWAQYFAKAPFRCVNQATDEYIIHNRIPPTVADIYEAGAMIFREEVDRELIDKL